MSVRLLLVEDNETLRVPLVRILTFLGFEVRDAADGVDALEVLAGYTPDVVITDVMMPRMDGLEMIRRIRAIPRLAAVPIVVITAAASEASFREAIAAGASAYLSKPVDSLSLKDWLDRLCGQGRQAGAIQSSATAHPDR